MGNRRGCATLGVLVLAVMALGVPRLEALSLEPGLVGLFPPEFSVLVSNDTFGPGPVQEWDDLRTFGGELVFGMAGGTSLAANFDAFTWRSGSALTGSRLDRLEIELSSLALDERVGALGFVAWASAGVVSYGAFGGLQMQERLHDGVGISRAVPERYDSYRSVGLTSAISAMVSLGDTGDPLPSVFAQAEDELPGPWMVEAGAGVRAVRGATQSEGWLVYRIRSAFQGSVVADEVSKWMSGPAAIWSVHVGALQGSVEMDPLNGTSLGTFGVRVNGADGVQRASNPMALEIFSEVSVLSPGRRVLFPLLGQWLRGLVSTAFGWWDASAPGNAGLRNAEYVAGFEGRAVMHLGIFEAEAACAFGPFFSLVTLQTLQEQRSIILDRTALLGLRLEPTLRLGLEQGELEGHLTRHGVGASLRIDSPTWSVVPFATQPTARDRTFKITVFVYAEAL